MRYIEKTDQQAPAETFTRDKLIVFRMPAAKFVGTPHCKYCKFPLPMDEYEECSIGGCPQKR